MTRYRARPLAVAVLACVLVGLMPAAVAARSERTGPAARSAPVTSLVRGAGSEPDALLVKLRPGVSEADAQRAFGAAGAAQIGRLDRIETFVLKATPGNRRGAVVAALTRSPLVESVERDGTARIMVEPNDRYWYAQWAERKIHGPRAWDVTKGDDSAIIAIPSNRWPGKRIPEAPRPGNWRRFVQLNRARIAQLCIAPAPRALRPYNPAPQ